MKILRFSFLLKSSFDSQSSGSVPNQNYSLWCCFPSSEIVTYFMLFCLVDNVPLLDALLTSEVKRAALQGCPSWEVYGIAHTCYDFRSSGKMFCSPSVLQEDQEGTVIQIWYNLPHFWKIVNKIQSFKHLRPALHQTLSTVVDTKM